MKRYVAAVLMLSFMLAVAVPAGAQEPDPGR